jgi:hypothetical protein
VAAFVLVAGVIALVRSLSSDEPSSAAGSGDGGQTATVPQAPPSSYLFGNADPLVRCATHPEEIRPASRMVPVNLKGKTYYLCCEDCAMKFEADPEPYIKNLERAEKKKPL